MEDLSKLETHLTEFFSEQLSDFSMLKPDSIKALTEVNKHFDLMAEKHKGKKNEEMRDPSVQFLDTIPSIGTPRLFKEMANSGDQMSQAQG